MFRRNEETLDPDPSFPADLKSLRYFINDLGHIRMIDAPDQAYVFRATTNDRVNEVYREAMRECMRQETEKRLAALGLRRFYLPQLTNEKPTEPHVPILVPTAEILKNRKRIVVIVNDWEQDLGILSYGQMQQQLGLNGGSVVNFAKEMVKRSAGDDSVGKYEGIFRDGFEISDAADVPALVVLNTGQLLYSHKHNTAMTLQSWHAMPRKSAMHPAIKIHEVENRVAGHCNAKEHVKSVFDEILCNTEFVGPGAEVYFVAIQDGTEHIISLLKEDFAKYGSRITGMALIHSLIDDSQIKDSTLRSFLHQRTRQWKISDLSNDPVKCVDLPKNFYENEPAPAHDAPQTTNHVSWSECDAGPATELVVNATKTAGLNTSGLSEIAKNEDQTEAWGSGHAVICPTFAGGNSLNGEHVFTDKSVQKAILDFFEEFARNPKHCNNSGIRAFNEAPKPSPENPLAFDPSEDPETLSPIAPEMALEQAELNAMREVLEQMKIAREACPVDKPELQKGRDKLVQRIANQEAKVGKLEREALAHGGLGPNEALDKRENWEPATEGEQVSFAGTTVDSELLRAAGLGETAEEELRKLHEN